MRGARGRVGFPLGVLALCAAAPACNWMTFADDANHAPVRSIGTPSGFKSQDFGQSVLPLSDGQGKAAAFVATSINGANMVVVTVDSGGAVGSTAVAPNKLLDLDDSEITSLVEVPGTTPLRLLLGTPEVRQQAYGRLYQYVLSPTLEGSATPLQMTMTESGLGRGLAVGRLGGDPNLPDYVVGSDDRLVVWIDGAPASVAVGVAGGDCDVGFDTGQDARYHVRRPLLAARFWTDAAGTVEQLVSGSTHSGAAGKLSFFSISTDGVTFGLDCIRAVPAPAMQPHFGKSLAAGDFNGDGATDLLVGAPGRDAFVYLGPFPAGAVPMPAPIAITDSNGLEFGYAVAALNVDGRPGDEALISDPYATVDGHDRAGHVVAYAWNPATMTMGLASTYADHSPQTNGNFGFTVNGLKFCTSTTLSPCPDASTSRMLMIGASNEVFLYYGVGDLKRDGSAIEDVRGP